LEVSLVSSHREAPEISKDPVADNTDTYAFVSPDRPDTVTILTNYLPAETPPGGPNFYEFGDDVLYSIYIDNDGDGHAEIEYQFRFSTFIKNPDTFLYNTGPIGSLGSPSWNKRQYYTVSRLDTVFVPAGRHHPARRAVRRRVLATGLASPPCNIGPRSTPNYPALAAAAVHALPSGETVFAGQRNEGFFVDLGSIFDLGDLRPLQNLHLIATSPAMGVDATARLNVHTIALQVPIKSLTRDRSTPTDPLSPKAVLGIYGAASRRKVRVIDRANDERAETGPWAQVSRLGMPLFNEVLVPLGRKDVWNALPPSADKAFLGGVQHPELAALLPVLYPGVFPNLAALKKPRADLVAIFLTGLPSGIVPGFQNYTGKVLADMLRLNVAVPPAKQPNALGVLGGDLGGFPNGRRVFDDVVNVELQALAGLTYPLVDKTYTPDAAASKLTQGLTPSADRYQATFPYLGTPHDGYDTPS
jgi:hypothetical protein